MIKASLTILILLHLPDNKHLIIDSKMSLVAYESAVNSEDENQRKLGLQEHESLKKSYRRLITQGLQQFDWYA
ncbi:DNA recombination protein rmuC [Canicola haemoglobinophilus]|uniref:DNA recombination protein rmuC n=1 Tax=Canicola haemoglobinophilus TaxID=733 RepID=A0AB38HDW0_9PAST|nr:DNA recombination protein rmuC [Canicola haemoglobinophilus]